MRELFSLYNTQECSGDADSTSAAAPAGAGAAVSRMGQLRAELGRGQCCTPHLKPCKQMASQGLVPEELLHEAKTPQAVPITQLKLNSSSRRITSSNYENRAF